MRSVKIYEEEKILGPIFFFIFRILHYRYGAEVKGCFLRHNTYIKVQFQVLRGNSNHANLLTLVYLLYIFFSLNLLQDVPVLLNFSFIFIHAFLFYKHQLFYESNYTTYYGKKKTQNSEFALKMLIFSKFKNVVFDFKYTTKVIKQYYIYLIRT